MLDGAQVEVTLAKPVDKDTYLRSPKLNRPFNVPAFYVPIDQYGSILPFYPSYFSPPKLVYWPDFYSLAIHYNLVVVIILFEYL